MLASASRAVGASRTMVQNARSERASLLAAFDLYRTYSAGIARSRDEVEADAMRKTRAKETSDDDESPTMLCGLG